MKLSSLNSVYLFGQAKHTSPEIFLSIESEFDPRILLEELKSLISRPPLSKYGLIPTLKIIRKRDLKQLIKIHSSESFFLYENGNTHYYKRKINGQDFISKCDEIFSKEKYKFPIIISNLGIRVSQKKVGI